MLGFSDKRTHIPFQFLSKKSCSTANMELQQISVTTFS
jgi:hypothetical protein